MSLHAPYARLPDLELQILTERPQHGSLADGQHKLSFLALNVPKTVQSILPNFPQLAIT